MLNARLTRSVDINAKLTLVCPIMNTELRRVCAPEEVS